MKYFIVDVVKESTFNKSNGVTIVEIEAFNNKTKLILETTSTDAYDSVTKDIPYYWNYSSLWSRDNLTDNNKNYTDNASGNSSACLMCYTTYGNSWARFLIKINSNTIDSIVFTLSNTETRFPKNISLYEIKDFSKYDKTINLNNRADDNLKLINSVELTLPFPTNTYDVNIELKTNLHIMKSSEIYYNINDSSIIHDVNIDTIKNNGIKSYELNDNIENIKYLLNANGKVNILTLHKK